MKPFYIAEDFKELFNSTKLQDLADIANAKLEREGQILYGGEHGECWYLTMKPPSKYPDTHKALLINVEPLRNSEGVEE